jgi:hypothetical protein
MWNALTIFVLFLGLLNLLLVLLVIRTLKRHAARLAQMPRVRPRQDPPVPRMLQDFTATTTAGQELTRQGLLGRQRVVAFLTPACTSCLEQIPRFNALAASPALRPGTSLLGVVLGRGPAAVQLAGQLSETADVVLEEPNGPLVRAFEATNYPGFHVLDADGVIQATGGSVAAIIPSLGAAHGVAANGQR